MFRDRKKPGHQPYMYCLQQVFHENWNIWSNLANNSGVKAVLYNFFQPQSLFIQFIFAYTVLLDVQVRLLKIAIVICWYVAVLGGDLCILSSIKS